MPDETRPAPAGDTARDEVAAAIARTLLEGFDKHYRLFRDCARRAKGHFERGEWHAIQQLSRDRIDFYDARVAEAVDRLHNEFAAGELGESIWPRVKLHYIGLIIDHKQPECAETFFNSVCCKILARTYFNNDYIFVRPTISTDHIETDPPSYRSYYPRKEGLRATMRRIVADFGLEVPFAHLGRDLRCVLRLWRRRLHRPIRLEANHQVQVLSSLFYRNKKAFVIGKVINGSHEYPFVVPIRHDDRGRLVLDTVLLDVGHLDVLVSANRAYFLVDMEAPASYVYFLRTMLTSKAKSELYTILGLQKHGKALFYRDLIMHLRHSSDEFVIAPGIRGLVMIVFMLPSFPYVFKVIRDVISRPKEVDRQVVKEKYWLVKHHDRVGRMADTLEYSDVALPRSRFSPEVLDELRRFAPSVIEEEGDTVVIRHLYIERYLTPLNLFLDRADERARRHAVYEYGLALKQLAAANIFAGDLLFKNFGVTRYGRVIFYDYDEIDYLTNVNFRRIPPPRTPEDELAAEPWYTIGPHDVFPEEFETFLLTDPAIRGYFKEHHADLLGPEYWKGVQERLRAGEFEDVFPYPQSTRFESLFGEGQVKPIPPRIRWSALPEPSRAAGGD